MEILERSRISFHSLKIEVFNVFHLTPVHASVIMMLLYLPSQTERLFQHLRNTEIYRSCEAVFVALRDGRSRWTFASSQPISARAWSPNSDSAARPVGDVCEVVCQLREGARSRCRTLFLACYTMIISTLLAGYTWVSTLDGDLELKFSAHSVRRNLCMKWVCSGTLCFSEQFDVRSVSLSYFGYIMLDFQTVPVWLQKGLEEPSSTSCTRILKGMTIKKR